MSHFFERPALGQKVGLGTFYSAYNDTFQKSCILKNLPAGSTQTSHHQKTTTGLSFNGSHKGRYDLLGLTPELGASIFTGLAPAEGSGKCLQDRHRAVGKFPSTEYYGAFHHQMTTAEDQLQVNNAVLREQINAHGLKFGEATHVVTGIVWGCQTVIVARCVSPHDSPIAKSGDASQVSDRESFSQAMTMFEEAVNGLRFIPDAKMGHVQGQETKYDVSAYSEAFDNGGMVLQDLREAFDLIKLLPSLLHQDGPNDGKGQPIQYNLLPIQTVAAIFGLRETHLPGNDRSLLSIPHDFLDTVMEHFDKVDSARSQLLGYASFLARHMPYIPLGHLQEVKDTIATVSTEMQQLKQTYAHILMHCRRHGLDHLEISNLLNGLQKLRSSCGQILDPAMDRNDQITFSSAAVARGAIYIGHNGVDFHKLLSASAALEREVYVFKFSQAAIRADGEVWDANCALLDELLDRKTRPLTETAIIILDCDALGQHLERVKIALYDCRGARVTQDLLDRQQFEADQSFAQWSPGALESGDDIKRPVQRRMVKIPCPGPKCNHLTACHWICSFCHGQIEFGYSDHYLYCDCGRAEFDKWKFKCNNASHESSVKLKKSRMKKFAVSSDGYMAYKSKPQLLSTLKGLEQSDYINILILGETGVGKSTFINSLVNYLSFETLEEAKRAEELNWVIPCSFSIQNMDRSQPNGAIKESKIQVGVRDDEQDGSKGASATQQTAVYPINVGSKTIRLIDTPGIGDTRGLGFDKKNMADILRTLSSYEQLHGILILLKSNNSRLTVTFNFCMQELLTHLHRSASRNMAFGFTNTRVSNYSPGDTFGPLTSLLGKHEEIGIALENQNTFCFDSESFRFLAAYKNNVFMENEEDFRRSWEHSRDEAVRLVQFFESKVPHQVKSTLSLNGTRQLIAELTKPMADISQTINTNIKVCSDQMEALRDTQLSGAKLHQRLKVPKVHLRTVKLDRPRTVCRNEDCVEWRDDGTGSVVRSYKNPCHSPCYLDNVEVDRVNCPELLKCWAFSSGRGLCCKPECGHSWQEHLHVYFELVEYTALVTDTEALRLFQLNKSDIVVKKKALEELECRIAEYQQEHAKIQQSAARFGIFLKNHSITPYNDATLEYLDMLIQEEKQKARVSRDETKLEIYRKDYAAHIELVKTLEYSMAAGGDNQPVETDVEAIVHELYSLQHFGQMLRDVKDGVVDAHQATYRERPFKVRGRASAGRTNVQRQPPMPSLSQRDQTWARVAAAPTRVSGREDGISRALVRKIYTYASSWQR